MDYYGSLRVRLFPINSNNKLTDIHTFFQLAFRKMELALRKREIYSYPIDLRYKKGLPHGAVSQPPYRRQTLRQLVCYDIILYNVLHTHFW